MQDIKGLISALTRNSATSVPLWSGFWCVDTGSAFLGFYLTVQRTRTEFAAAGPASDGNIPPEYYANVPNVSVSAAPGRLVPNTDTSFCIGQLGETLSRVQPRTGNSPKVRRLQCCRHAP